MSVAIDLNQLLFEAIELRFTGNADLMQQVGRYFRDFVPETAGNTMPYIVASQGQEGGATEWCAGASGLEPAEESFPITFDVYAATTKQASAIAWAIAEAFRNWRHADAGLRVTSTYRTAPPWVGQTEQGVCSATVSFEVKCQAVEQE